MQILCKFYANFIAISLFCGLLAINSPAWAQIYSHKMRRTCGSIIEIPIFDLPPLLPVEQRIDSSSFVFAGRWISSKKIPHNNRDYYCATVAVYRIYKGDFMADTVEVLTYYGRDPEDKRPQYIGGISKEWAHVWFVNQNNVFNTQNPNGRLRFRLALLNGSTAAWDEIGLSMHIINDNAECYETADGFKKISDGIKKITKKCIDVAAMRKKKAKLAAKVP